MPPGLAARLAAAALLADVVGLGTPLDERFGPEASPKRFADLDPRDRALVRSIAIVSLRRLGTLRTTLARFLERNLPKKAGALEWILITGAAQILFMDVPDHAAVDLAVRAVRRDPKTTAFSALVNAVLRNIVRERESLLGEADPFLDTPSWLAARWTKTYGEETARGIAAAHRLEPALDITVKGDPQSWADRLEGIVLPTGSVRLRNQAPVADLPGYGEGQWWVQDAAAALPALLLDARPEERVADLCAAPGGKTAQLANRGARVTAIDRSAERLKRLSGNLGRLELTAEITVGDVLSSQAGPFDAVLLDAPCTATGTIRRHPDVAWVKRASDIGALAAVQAKMLDRSVAMLRPGGRLIYCTCSLEPEEGEAQITALLRRNPDVVRNKITAKEIFGLDECITPAGDLRTLPIHLPNSEPRLGGLAAFFAARLVRRA
jgi:16S rRNA (cytosine967-C5)-methyltransferase